MSDEKQKSLRDQWGTPQEVFTYANTVYGPFDLDVCATKQNAKVDAYYSLDFGCDGLQQDWHKYPGGFYYRIWMNPPYSDPYPWIKKASEEAKKGCRVVALVNADHTTAWYKEFIWDYENDCERPGVTIDKWPKRIKFDAPPGLVSKKTGKPVKHSTNNWPSILVVFDPPLPTEAE